MTAERLMDVVLDGAFNSRPCKAVFERQKATYLIEINEWPALSLRFHANGNRIESDRCALCVRDLAEVGG